MSLETFATSVATKGFVGLLNNLVSSYLSRKRRQINASEVEIKTDMSSHLEISFLKCVKVKTILNDTTPVDTLGIYVDQVFKHEGKTVDQYDLIDSIRSGRTVVLTGHGGGGKSMFMRYLWLSFFERPQGMIPFFLELRHLNSYSHNSIEDFIYHSIIKAGSKISAANFGRALAEGEFILFLDGFDEINYDQRERFEKAIIQLKENNPKTIIVVTIRPDDRFSGWVPFDIVAVQPMPLKRAQELIERAPYDEALKLRFLKKIVDLYKSHTSFMSNPLLCYMMLVTFSFNPNIPSKMFLFYEQAFEALYHRHDLTKGGYRRRFHCKLEKQEFIRLISYFCLKGYHDEKYEFSENELRETIDVAKSIESIDVATEDFLKDMIESVCLLKKDGINYNFTPRSFQEYFASYCISRVATRNIEGLFAHFSKRSEDNVLRMVYDINPDLFREKYVIPMRRRYISFFEKTTTRNDFERLMSLLNAVFEARIRNVEMIENSTKLRHPSKKVAKRELKSSILLNFSGDFEPFCRNMKKLRNESLERREDERDRQERQELDDKFVLAIRKRHPSLETLFVASDGRYISIKVDQNDITNLELCEDFKKTNMYRYVKCEAIELREFVNKEIDKYMKTSSSFKDYF